MASNLLGLDLHPPWTSSKSMQRLCMEVCVPVRKTLFSNGPAEETSLHCTCNKINHSCPWWLLRNVRALADSIFSYVGCNQGGTCKTSEQMERGCGLLMDVLPKVRQSTQSSSAQNCARFEVSMFCNVFQVHDNLVTATLADAENLVISWPGSDKDHWYVRLLEKFLVFVL